MKIFWLNKYVFCDEGSPHCDTAASGIFNTVTYTSKKMRANLIAVQRPAASFDTEKYSNGKMRGNLIAAQRQAAYLI